MSTDTIDGISKEPEEVKFKGIDLTTWLQDSESVTDWYIEAYEITPETAKSFDLSNVQYLDVITYNEDGEVVNEETRWEMSNEAEIANLTVQRPVNTTEVTESIIVGEHFGTNDPNKWVQRVNEGKYRIGIKNGEVGLNYRISVSFDTDSGRTELIHFPVTIIDVSSIG